VQVLFTNGDQLVNMGIALLMVLAGVLLGAFRIQDDPAGSTTAIISGCTSAITSAKARMFMPVKAYSEAAVASGLAQAAAAAGGGDSSVLETGQMPVSPGAAGRWLLPEAAGDWDSWANLMDSVHVMSGLWATYHPPAGHHRDTAHPQVSSAVMRRNNACATIVASADGISQVLMA